VQRNRITNTCLALFMAIALCEGSAADAESTVKNDRDSLGKVLRVMIPHEIEKIPGRYFDKSDEPGTLTDLHYQTYESFSYHKKSKPLRKHAVALQVRLKSI
jgi:hypothetical protein